MKCIVCGKEGERPRSKFCCAKCEQHYYYEKNKKQRTEYKKEYYQENKEKCNKRSKKWFKENKEKWNEYQKKRWKEANEKCQH